MAWVGSGLVIALVLGSPIGVIISSTFDWRIIFASIGVFFILLIPFNYTYWRKNILSSTKKTLNDNNEKIKSGFIFYFSMILWGIGVYSIYTLLGTWLNEKYHNNNYLISIILASFGVGAFLGGVLGGKISDKIGNYLLIKVLFFISSFIAFIYHFFVLNTSFLFMEPLKN